MADLESSKRFWEEKAKENPLWYVSSYGSFANRDEAQFWNSGDQIWREIKREAEYRPTATDTVVEVGCGVGRLTRAIAADVAVCHAFDISEAMLARAREAIGRGVAFHLAHGASLRPVGDGVADFVLAYCVFQHLPSEAVLAANLSEMVRVAKPGALVVFTTAPKDWRSRLLPLSRLKSVLMAAFRRTGPKGTYKKEWVGIRPSRTRVERLCPVPVEFRALPGGRWLYWGRKPVTQGELERDMGTAAYQDGIHVKTPDEAKATVAEWKRIDRGFLGKRTTLLIILTGIVGAALSWWPVPAVAVCVVVADFIVFCNRRVGALRRYESGTPRLVTADDFAAANKSYQSAGVPEPNMGDWAAAAGMAEHAAWRADLRYQELLKHYEGGEVADVGCGDGRLLWRYKTCEPENYIGIEVGEDLLRQLRERASNFVRTVKATADATTLPDSSVDFVACTEVFEHLPHPEIAMREFNRILRPGGKIVIQSPNATRLRNLNPIHALCCLAGMIFPSLLANAESCP